MDPRQAVATLARAWTIQPNGSNPPSGDGSYIHRLATVATSTVWRPSLRGPSPADYSRQWLAWYAIARAPCRFCAVLVGAAPTESVTMVKIRGTIIEDTYAEAFRMRYARLIVTAHDQHWLAAALGEVTGYGASVIACDAEVGVEQHLPEEATPDARPGASILLFGFSVEAVAKAVAQRTGQCLMTCPTTAVYDGLPESLERVPLGKQIRYFGDGFQKSKQLAGRRFWRVPVMDGEFLVEESVGVAKGVAGGNIVVQAARLEAALAGARRGGEALAELPNVVTPFPGGIARSGSKVGSRYKGLVASTADAYCPTLRGRVATALREGVSCAYEIVIDGVDQEAVARAMGAAIEAAAGAEIVAIGAGNYGGKLGKFHFRLHDLL